MGKYSRKSLASSHNIYDLPSRVNWANDGTPKTIGSGWGAFTRVFSGGDGVIYAITSAGDLLFYRDLARDGTISWADDGTPKTIGAGWGGFAHVFSGGDGIIYAVSATGDLFYYRDLARDGTVSWANDGSAATIGSGWL